MPTAVPLFFYSIPPTAHVKILLVSLIKRNLPQKPPPKLPKKLKFLGGLYQL